MTDDWIIVRFRSRKEHESYCTFTGAGSRFIEVRQPSGAINVLALLPRLINRYGELVPNPAFLHPVTKKPLQGARVTPEQRKQLLQAGTRTDCFSFF